MTARRSAIAGVVAFACAVAIAASTARGAPAAAQAHQAFALIVTNNRSGALGRPDLQYADDDGARYYELFLTLAPAEHLRLLTEFDRDTARSFPELAAVIAPPSRGNVQAAARDLARKVAAARSAGASVDFYFVFAGHGDVDRGRGFLELGDGAFYGDDVEAAIAQVRADRAHIILDSCNSYFVINARKPGGRRFATPLDATGLARRAPNVGVFVSTSAEAEVFEWSELQSGVFSHAVRSGLAGAADADGDGTVSYDELRAFVDTATAEIRNAAFRPKVFARGPSGDDHTALFAPPTVGQQLTLDARRAIRLTVRDRDDLAWIDVYKEAGAPLTLRLPPGLTRAYADELAVRQGEVARIRRSELPGPATDRVALGDLPTAPNSATARGPDQLFRRLFTLPFGPAALARYDAERAAAPPPMFGISHEEAARMAHLLEQVDDAQRQYRRISAALGLGFGAAAIIGAALTPSYATKDSVRWGVVSGGALLFGFGAFQAVRDPASEHLHAELAAGLASNADPGPLLARIDRRLHDAADTAARSRWILLGGGAALLAGTSVAYVLDNQGGDGQVYTRSMTTAGAALGAMAILAGCLETPVERTTRLWDQDLASETPRFVLAPVSGGAALTLAGRF